MDGNEPKVVKLSSGVPQGSILRPTLWNVLYDSLLRICFPHEVSFLAFADDVAIVVEAKNAIEIGQLLTYAAEKVQRHKATKDRIRISSPQVGSDGHYKF